MAQNSKDAPQDTHVIHIAAFVYSFIYRKTKLKVFIGGGSFMILLITVI